MSFADVSFLLLFLPIFLIVYYLTPIRFRNIVMIAGSILFYIQGSLWGILVLTASVAVNYRLGCRIGSGRSFAFWGGIAVNVGFLSAAKLLCAPDSFPLGASFYTFQALSYLADVRRQKIQAEQSFTRFAAYMCMFPQLISGPIVRYGQVRRVLRTPAVSLRRFEEGGKWFILGLAEKVLLADRLALLWNELNTIGYESISVPMAWLGAVAFSLQLYFDFNGYSMMAVGLGRMLGYSLPENFDHPYMAGSVREFYSRWHMTLTGWFKDYIYIPLGGNRKGVFFTLINLTIVWFLTGIWHGTTLNFLCWAGLLLCLVILEKLCHRMFGRIKCGTPGRFLGMALSRCYLWIVIPVSWMMFAISDLSQLRVYLGRMFDLIPGIHVNTKDYLFAIYDYGWLLALALLLCTPLLRKIYDRYRNSLCCTVFVVCLFWLCVWMLQRQGNNTFMYFRF